MSASVMNTVEDFAIRNFKISILISSIMAKQ